MDIRRELDLINKHFDLLHAEAGEAVVWYEFLPVGTSASVESVYDDIYDEGNPGVGGRRYKPGIIIPTLLLSENEDERRAIPDGRLPVQTLDMFVPLKAAREAGLSDPYEYKKHLNDLFLYDGRYYNVFGYRVRGRLRDEVFILIKGIETYVDQEFVNDPGPESMGITNFPWPTNLPTIG